MTMPIPEGYTQEEFDSLSDVEREALGYELHDKGPSVTVDDSELAAANAAKATQDAATEAAAKEAAEKATKDAADKAAKDAADKAAAEASGTAAVTTAATGSEVKPAEEPASVAAAPVAVADTPDINAVATPFKVDKVVSDEEHKASQAELAKKFEDGEVTTAEFIQQNEALTRAKLQSDMAVASTTQTEEARWQAEQSAFFNTKGNEVIRDDPRVHAAMQAQLEVMYGDPAKASYTNMQFLNEAGREVRKLFGLEAAPAAAAAAAAPAAKPAASAVPTPATLAGVPAADSNIDQGNEFSFLDKLNGMEYENAIARMPADQRARYLAM